MRLLIPLGLPVEEIMQKGWHSDRHIRKAQFLVDDDDDDDDDDNDGEDDDDGSHGDDDGDDDGDDTECWS